MVLRPKETSHNERTSLLKLAVVCLQFILLFGWIDYSPARYGDYYFPPWADALGWLMTISSVIWIPVFMIVLFCRADGGVAQVCSCVCACVCACVRAVNVCVCVCVQARYTQVC